MMCDERIALAEGHFRCMMVKGHQGDHHNNTQTVFGQASISWSTSEDSSEDQ